MKILHNGVEIDISDNPEYKAHIAQVAATAATAEKNKLYPQIEAAKNKPAQHVGLTKEDVLEILRQNPTTSQPATVPTQQGITQEQLLKLLNDKMPEVVKAAVAPMNEAINRLQSESLGEYRTRRAKETFGDTAEKTLHLIKGSTREEIDASITAIEALRASWVPPVVPAPVVPAPVVPQVVTPTPQTPATTPAAVVTPQVVTPPPPPPAQGNNPAPTIEPLEERVKKMTPEEYEKNRANILKEMANTIPTLG